MFTESVAPNQVIRFNPGPIEFSGASVDAVFAPRTLLVRRGWSTSRRKQARRASPRATRGVRHAVDETLDAIFGGGIAKGDVLAVARVAGIQGAKQCGADTAVSPARVAKVAVDFDRDAAIVCDRRPNARSSVRRASKWKR